MPGMPRGSYSFKMPGMDGWNAPPPPMNQYQSTPQQQPPQQQQQQSPIQQPPQQGGQGPDFQQHIPFVQQLFPQPQPQQRPGAGIGPEHMQVRVLSLPLQGSWLISVQEFINVVCRCVPPPCHP